MVTGCNSIKHLKAGQKIAESIFSLRPLFDLRATNFFQQSENGEFLDPSLEK